MGLADQLMLRGGHDAIIDHQRNSSNTYANYALPYGWWTFSYSQSDYRSQAEANGFAFKQTGDSQSHTPNG